MMGLMPRSSGCLIKAHGAEQIAVIRNRGSRHLEINHSIHDRVDFAGSIEQAVIGMEMEMDEFSLIHGVYY